MKSKKKKQNTRQATSPYVLDIAKEADSVLQHAQKFWDDFSDDIENSEYDVQKLDPLAHLNYVSELEEARTGLLNELYTIEHLKQELDKEDLHTLSAKDKEFVLAVRKEMNSLLRHLPKQLQEFLDIYQELIEEVLNQVEVVTVQLSEKVLESKTILQSKQVRMDLDYEEELKELRDALESIREIRLNSGAEHENDKEEDGVLRILDSLITTCDYALHIEESSM